MLSWKTITKLFTKQSELSVHPAGCDCFTIFFSGQEKVLTHLPTLVIFLTKRQIKHISN